MGVIDKARIDILSEARLLHPDTISQVLEPLTKPEAITEFGFELINLEAQQIPGQETNHIDWGEPQGSNFRVSQFTATVRHKDESVRKFPLTIIRATGEIPVFITALLNAQVDLYKWFRTETGQTGLEAGGISLVNMTGSYGINGLNPVSATQIALQLKEIEGFRRQIVILPGSEETLSGRLKSLGEAVGNIINSPEKLKRIVNMTNIFARLTIDAISRDFGSFAKMFSVVNTSQKATKRLAQEIMGVPNNEQALDIED